MNRYVLVGAGGTGSHFLSPFLSYVSNYHRLDPWELHVVDGDDVEPKNLERQLFNGLFVGMNKARALLLPLQEEYRQLVEVPVYLDENNISLIVTEGSTVFIAVDNYPVRALIEQHCKSLRDCVIINGGNERASGTCQIYIRRNGEDITPPLSFLHPEIAFRGKNRADMSCEEIANLPGGEQLIVTNMASAMHMLNALMMVHADDISWTELAFDLDIPQNSWARDNRPLRGWR